MSADPLTIHALGADPNVYAYVSGAALKTIDPLGLADCGPDYCAPGAAKSTNAETSNESKSGWEAPPIKEMEGGARAEREVEVTAGGARSPKAGPSWADRPMPEGLRTREAQTWGQGIKLGVETNPWAGGAGNELLTKAIQKIGQWLGKLRAGAAVADDLAYATAGGTAEANVARMVAKAPSGGPAAAGAGAAPAAKAGTGIGRVVNSKMGHAADRAVERAGFATKKEARTALKNFAEAIVKDGLPAGTVRDAAGHLVVPGFGQGGAVVYRQSGKKLTLQTVVTWIEGMGTPIR